MFMVRPPRANCWLRKGLRIAANRPTFAGESRRKCPRNRSSSLGRWVFGNHGCCCDEQSSQFHRCWVVTVLAVAASVAGSHVSPQVRSNPKATASVRCLCNMPPADVSLRKERLDVRPLRAKHASRTTRIVSRGLAPFAGKGRASARAATGEGASTSVEPPEPLGLVSPQWLAIGERRGRKLVIAPVSAPPGKGCRWPAECVTVWFVHAS